MVDIQPVNTTYEPFSLEPEYVEANRRFVQRQSLSHVRRFLDLACGTGTVTELLLEASPSAHLNGIDLDPEQIRLICRRFRDHGYEVRRGFELSSDVAHNKPVLTFAVGSAEELPFPAASFDCVTIFNAIHLLSNKEGFLTSVHRVLEPGGLLGFNSTFYAGAIPPGGNKLYFEWLRLATEYIQKKNGQLKAEGKEPIRRVRGTRPGAFTNRWWSPQEWSDLLLKCGFQVQDVHERLVETNPRGFALVGAYGGLAEVLMSGYPVDAASEALQACAKPAMDAVNTTTVPRNYLEIWGTKR
jgi:ubiquinone/menaquinone biosynthesis C-methylase UbiE